MGIKELVSQARSRIGEARVRGAHRAALREDIRREERVAERKSFRIEAVKVATKRGIERARRPSGLAGFAAGIQTLSAGVGKLSAATAPRPVTRRVKRKGKRKATRRTKATRRVIRRTSAPSRPAILDFKF